MRHLIIAAFMIAGSLLAVQTTVGMFEWMAARGHQAEDDSLAVSPPAARDVPTTLHLPAAVPALPHASLSLPARTSTGQI